MGTLEFLMDEVTRVFKPLAKRIQDDQIDLLFAELGLNLPASATANTNFKTALTNLSTEVLTTVSIIEEIRAAIDNNDKATSISKSVEALTHLKTIFTTLESIANSLKNDIGAAAIGITDAELDDFIAALPKRLPEYLAITNLEDNIANVADVLEFLKIITRTEITSTGNPSLPSFTKKELDPQAFLNLLSAPVQYLEDQFDWNKNTFDGSKLFSVLAAVLLRRGIPVLYDATNAPSVLNAFFAKLSVDTSEPVPGVMIEPTLDSYATAFSIQGDAWKFNSGIGINLTGDAKLSLFPDGKIKVNIPGFAGGKIFATWQAAYPDKPLEILSITGGSKVEATSFSVTIEADLDSTGAGNFSLTGELTKIHTTVDLSSGDNFVKKTGGNGFESDIDLKFGYSTTAGFFIAGSGSFDIKVPTHVSIGPVDITALTVDIGLGSGKIPVSIGGDIRTSLGPLVVVINNIGFRLEFSAANDNSGNLGRLQVTPSFKAPEGIGLSIDAGGLKGGGILDFNPDKKEYFGAMELEFRDMFSIKAFGIINTEMPDGSDGFSLLIVITTEFTPLQLGFGFTLNGVGGLLGLNRTVRLDVLKEGIKTNTLQSILFPQNVVANISRIVSDIKQVFPPQSNHFLICPMGKIGWGTPTIITLELGLLIEIPTTGFTILGVLKAILPDEDNPLLKLQVNFVGVVDFENKSISFDAALFDSRLLIYTLTGQMALRIVWSDHPTFLLSVGGFHPAFKEVPADLKNMQRITISLLSGENPRITIQSYFAVTSNTAQFGAKAELYAEGGGFNIYGFIGFDELYRLNPFSFVADFNAGLALRRNTSVIMSITVTGEISGPSPWDARGEASISFFFFSVSVTFHETWGHRDDGIPEETIDIRSLLTNEINDDRNWRADIPSNNKLHVSIKKIGDAGDAITIHPFGILTFSERLVPLGITIDKLGYQVPKDANNFEIDTTDTTLVTQPVTELFAPANFFNLTDDEKLARPSFEPMKSGFQITSSTALQAPPTVVSKHVDYEFSYLREKRSKIIVAGIYQYPRPLFTANIKGNAVSKSSLSFINSRVSTNAPAAVSIQEEQYAVANVADMKLYSHDLVASSYTEAQQFLNDVVKANPELRDRLQIVSQYELNF